MLEIFKTNIEDTSDARMIIDRLHRNFPGNSIHIDLHDCDKILRVQGEHFPVDQIIAHVKASGFDCTVLEN